MKNPIVILICSLFLISSVYGQEFQFKVISYTTHNWIIGWGVDYTVKLKNTGDITAKNIRLIFINEISNQTFTYKDTSYADWDESLIPTAEKKKSFSRELPTGFKVISSTVSAFIKQ